MPGWPGNKRSRREALGCRTRRRDIIGDDPPAVRRRPDGLVRASIETCVMPALRTWLIAISAGAECCPVVATHKNPRRRIMPPLKLERLASLLNNHLHARGQPVVAESRSCR